MTVHQKVAAVTRASRGVGAGLVQGGLDRNYLVMPTRDRSRLAQAHQAASPGASQRLSRKHLCMSFESSQRDAFDERDEASARAGAV